MESSERISFNPLKSQKQAIVKKIAIYQQSAFVVEKFIKFNTFVKQTNSDI